RIGVAIALVAVGKMLADISEAGGAEQCVDHCVGEHVGVGVAVEAQLTGDLHATEDQRPTRDQPMGVVANAAERSHRTPAPLACPPLWGACSPASELPASAIGSRRRCRRSNTHSSLTPALSSSSSARS